MTSNPSSGRSTHRIRRQQELRRGIWPDSDNEVWSKDSNDGYTSIPRILPLIGLLITILDKTKSSSKGNPSKVYFDLWCRVFEAGFIEVINEEEYAYSSGYMGPRAARTWKEHIKRLSALGFVKTAENGNREIGYILIVDPYLAAEKLRAQAGRVPDDWWNTFLNRLSATGAKLPSAKKKKDAPKSKTKTKVKRRPKKASTKKT